MRKCNRKMAERAGSVATKEERLAAPALGHFFANSKPFQLAANHLLSTLVRRAV